ncbi:ankyrin repeat-containing domain protein [Hypoxylon cercidicola]|nr:ankyrin repeat-containing domain protein [Hypoxylon cercidicola]
MSNPGEDQKSLLKRFPDELTLAWVGMVSNSDDLFTLFRVGNWKLTGIAEEILLKTNSRALHSALYWACMKGDINFLEQTVKYGAEVDRTFPYQGMLTSSRIPAYRVAGCALNIAIHHQQVGIVRILLEKYNANCSAVDGGRDHNKPYTSLQWALYLKTPNIDEEKRLRIVNLLLDHDASPLHWGDGPDVDPFMNALLNDHIPVSVVKRMAPMCIQVYHSNSGFETFYYNDYIRRQSTMTSEEFTPNELQKLDFLQDLTLRQRRASASWTSSQLLNQAFFTYTTLPDLTKSKREQLLALALEKYMRTSVNGSYLESPFVMAVEAVFWSNENGFPDSHPTQGIRLFQALLDAGLDSTQIYESEDDPVNPGAVLLPFEKAGEYGTKHTSTVLAFLCLPEHAKTYQVSEMVDFLVQQGTPVDTKDHFGLTALHYASKFSVAPRVKQLLERGADANAVDNRGLTPLHFACRLDTPFNMGDMQARGRRYRRAKRTSQKQRLNICRLLLNNKADPSVSDKDGFTPLHYACKYGFLDLVKLLLADPKVNVKATASDLSTPVHLLPWRPLEELTEPDSESYRRLTRDIRYGFVRTDDNSEIAKILLDAGADARAEDGEGWLPIRHARKYADQRVVDVLLGRGGDDGLIAEWALKYC